MWRRAVRQVGTVSARRPPETALDPPTWNGAEPFTGASWTGQLTAEADRQTGRQTMARRVIIISETATCPDIARGPATRALYGAVMSAGWLARPR